MADRISPRHQRRLSVLRIVIGLYWLMMFAVTHAPLTEQIEELPGTDKHLHFAAYFVLGGLLMLWHGVGRVATRSRAGAVIALLALYAAVDELSQPLVNREADLLDWAADVCGVLAGVVVAFCVARLIDRRRGHTDKTAF